MNLLHCLIASAVALGGAGPGIDPAAAEADSTAPEADVFSIVCPSIPACPAIPACPSFLDTLRTNNWLLERRRQPATAEEEAGMKADLESAGHAIQTAYAEATSKLGLALTALSERSDALRTDEGARPPR